MILESLLNQFESDWANAPLREKNFDINKISDKNIVISGNSMLARALIVTFLVANDKKKLNNKIICAFDGQEDLFDISIFSERNDFECINYNDFLCNVDIWLETNFLLSDDFESVTDFSYLFTKADCIVKLLSSNNIQRFLLLSDVCVYGELPKGVLVSEKEYGNIDYLDFDIKTVTMQAIENMFVSAAQQYNFEYTILRTPLIICDFSNSENIKLLIENIAVKKPFDIENNNVKMSYISINDLLTAVFCVLINSKSNSVFNVAFDSAVTSNELFTICEELFDDCKVSLADKGIHITGCSVNNTSLKKLGWIPLLDIKDALLISKHAYLNTDEVFMFPDAYDGKLEAIQKILLGFLKEVDRICQKHDIKYFLGGGTLLGAVRHKGFIPWDDDADVMMLREDYDKFLEVLSKELPDNLSYQTYKGKEKNHFPFTKIRINNTVLSTEFTSRFDYLNQGIFLDILAQDKTSNNKFISKIHMHATGSLRWLVLNKWRGTPVDARSKVSSCIANALKKILPMSVLEWAQHKMMALYKNKKSDYLFDSMGRNISNGRFPIKWLEKAIWIDFEDTKLPVPVEYDKYLTYLYGNYMEMIPVSKRHVSHEIIQIDLGEYENYSH